MTNLQLLLLFIVLVFWAALALELVPLLRGRHLRRGVALAGWTTLAGLLLVSLLAAEDRLRWLLYAVGAAGVLLALWAYSRWANRPRVQLSGP